MIISTSSHNVQLTEDIYEYVEDTLQHALGRVAGDVVSIDTRLETVRNPRNRLDVKATVRVDLRDRGALVTESRDDNLYTAIRRGAANSARAIRDRLQH